MKLHPVFYILVLFLIFVGFSNVENFRKYLVSTSFTDLNSTQKLKSSEKKYTIRYVNKNKPKGDPFIIKGFVIYTCPDCLKKRIVISEQKITILDDSKLTYKDIIVYVKNTKPFILHNYYTMLVKPRLVNNTYTLDLIKILNPNSY